MPRSFLKQFRIHGLRYSKSKRRLKINLKVEIKESKRKKIKKRKMRKLMRTIYLGMKMKKTKQLPRLL